MKFQEKGDEPQTGASGIEKERTDAGAMDTVLADIRRTQRECGRKGTKPKGLPWATRKSFWQSWGHWRNLDQWSSYFRVFESPVGLNATDS